jgi:hypothetical protein
VNSDAVQDFFSMQPAVVVGLISMVTGSALQEDIAATFGVLVFVRQIHLVLGFSKRECRLSISVLPPWIGTWKDCIVNFFRLA